VSDSLVEDVLFGPEVDVLSELPVNLLLELHLQLSRRLHAVLGRTQYTARLTLFLLSQLDDVTFLQQALNQAACGRYRRLLSREPLQLPRQTVLFADSAAKPRHNCHLWLIC